MAAVLEALLPYVKKMITDMAEEEVGLLLGVHGEMEKLGRNLHNIKAFLADAEKRRITEELVQGWVRMLKGVMYDATDVLELGQLKAEERRESKLGRSMEKKMPGCCQPFLFCLRNPVFAHKIGSRIKELNQRLEEIHKEAAKFNFTANLHSYPEQGTKAYEDRTSASMAEPDVIGEKIERDTRMVVHELTITTDENQDIMKVVSIVGMGGMGKTTLAKMIFRDKTVDEHFKTKIWLSITQQFNKVELLRNAIKQAGGDYGTDEINTRLTHTLTTILSTRKFILVLDDMWGIEAWEHVFSIPARNAAHKQPGSRVLITTRFEDLAPRMHDLYHQHRVNPLDDIDAWSLLKKQLPCPHNEQVIDHLKDIGMKIIKKCGGLPLAIKIMGGLLRAKPLTDREWEAVLNHQTWSLDGLPEELDRRLYLSYQNLSPQLKQCLLYCCLIPKGTFISQNKIISMWISEGFVQHPNGCMSPEEVAKEYYHELIMRNLIEPCVVTRYDCTMHDVVRSFAEFMAREECLVLHDEQDSSSGSIGLVRRLSVGSTKSVPEWALLQKQKSLRTLIINCKINVKPDDSLTSFSSLRVLCIEHADCDRLVDSLCQLQHLRYLWLGKTNISSMPDDIHRLKFLQCLAFVDCRSLERLPSSIAKLAHLRELNIEGSQHVLIAKGFGALTNLRLLFGFPVHMEMDEGWCSLEEIGPLSQLTSLTLFGLENASTCCSWAEKAMISSKGHLSYLKLNCSSSRYMGWTDKLESQQQQKAVEEVFEKLCPPTCVEHLWINGYFGHQLPHWMMIPATSTFKSLRYLTMEDLPCCTQLPDGLCQLPSLELLQIEAAPSIESVGPEFQASSVAVGGGITCTLAAFPSLKNLFFKGLCEWKEWEWEEQGDDVTADVVAMPALKILTIGDCKLGFLPPGLASVKRLALRELNLYQLGNLTSVENFPSVVELDVFNCPELKRISGLSRLQRISIICCPNLEVLEGVPELDSLVLEDYVMETLPEYLRGVYPRHLKLSCSRKLCEFLSPGSSEWDKISHIRTHAIHY